jgi:hypothetical protein
VAERDRKASYEADQQQQQQPGQTQQQTDRGNVSQQAAELMLAILQQVQTQIRSGTLNLTTPIQEEQLKNAAFAGAAFSSIENGLALSPAFTVDTISPPNGSKDGGFPMTIKGKNFLPGAKVFVQSTITSTSKDLVNVVVISHEEIQGTTPQFSNTGAVDVVVVTSIGGEARKASGFDYT